MNGLEFANRFVAFEKSSPISGRFFITKYKFLSKPLLALDDIGIKRMIVYKASSCLGTVFSQIAMAYRLDRRPGDMLFVAQSDDDADHWSKVRGRPFLERIPSLTSTLKDDKYAVTNKLWQWPHQFLEITGPGVNAQNSKQVRYVHTDESHLPAFTQGSLEAFEGRTGERWDRSVLHITTAAEQGKEVDNLYHAANQDEWHQRCPNCNDLIWLLWRDAAKQHYGHEIFQWKEMSTDAMTIDTLRCICPLCGKEFFDAPKVRRFMGENGDYIAMNPSAPPSTRSFRWNCFSAEWIPFQSMLSKYLLAIRAARIGDLSLVEEFTKKRECRTWKNEMPDTGDTVSSADYSLGSPWIKDMRSLMNMSLDVQESGGFHLFAQVDEFCENGDSRRQFYGRLETWQRARDLQHEFLVADKNVHPDYGNRDREVFEVCSEFRWVAFKGSDEDSFAHFEMLQGKKFRVEKPFSELQIQDAKIGKVGRRGVFVKGRMPIGICASHLWSNPAIYPILYALKNGESSRYYGIASDIPESYLAQLNTHVPSLVTDKFGNQNLVWICLKPGGDHSWDTSCMNLIDAIQEGFFPMAFRRVDAQQQIVASAV